MQYIIEYICKYQNTYVSSYLFTRNIPTLIEKGIEVKGLFESQIFCFQFDYDEWPATHIIREEHMRPYNSSIFNLRTSYKDVFFEPMFSSFVEEELSDSSKIYKVSYYINMLPMLEKYAVRQDDGSITYENDGVSLMALAAESDELDIFDCVTFQQLIKFKWDTFAWALHMRGCVMHFFYLLIMILYINSVYIANNMDH